MEQNFFKKSKTLVYSTDWIRVIWPPAQLAMEITGHQWPVEDLLDFGITLFRNPNRNPNPKPQRMQVLYVLSSDTVYL